MRAALAASRRLLLPLAAVAVLGLAACEEESTGVVADPSDFIPTDYQITSGFEFTSTVDGVRNAEVVADSTWQWTDSSSVRLFGVQMNFFDSLGIASARLTSQEARLDVESQDLEARGNAVLNVFARNATIQSPVLYYSPEQNEIRSDTVTRAVIDGDPLTGTTFVSDLQFRNITVTQPVGNIPDVMVDTVETAAPTGSGLDDERREDRDEDDRSR
ncbi:MAG TPA: LPS export ABC transporter periplasmic protein LptC [Longimicrobiales bacterium]|nr:LPS export ABC transporter periplasmic protein LptC [Longimicrobiales bacterium]